MAAVQIAFTITNMLLAVWVSISTISALFHHQPGRDTRPLVMPIFCGLSYFGLAFTWLGAGAGEYHNAMTLLAWQMTHFGMLLGLQLFVRTYGEHREK